MKLIPLDAVLAEIERRYKLVDKYETNEFCAVASREELVHLKNFINSLEVKEANNVWHEVDNVNQPQPDKNKIYCVLSKNKYLLAKVIEHPHDELLQWKCTEFPFHRYDMCEGDKYMQIV